MASIKGVKFAKKVLDPNLMQKLSKSNKLGLLTYITLATVASVGTALGVKIKDAIAKPKPVS
ncbi:MAG: hypothetical protein A2Y25_04780 [Candidatus Melainabacteria bacterium GWF2_37_15]|nr:MAG: hypothetical protein A2Y25_04780 [Candidatus Melainabacteria bacterium GWF2_37_15]